MPLSIPSSINDMDRLEAAQVYIKLGWTLNPCNPWQTGKTENEKGKKPLFTGYRDRRLDGVTPKLLDKWFGNGADNNIGLLVKPPLVVVDLDSKHDKGASVREWIESRPELADVPRERTTCGVHVYLICDDVPTAILGIKEGKLSHALNPKVNVEVFLNRTNVVVTPSKHKSGAFYTFEVTGEVPTWPWAGICKVFGLPQKSAGLKLRKRHSKTAEWRLTYRGDVTTLDAVKLFTEAGCLAIGECLDPETHKHEVLCPWRDQHSVSEAERDQPGSSTVIFAPPYGMPGFKCFHAHCQEKKLRDVLEFVEAREPGLVDKCCQKQRPTESETGTSEDERPQVRLPGKGRPISDFAREVGAIIAPKFVWFMRDDVVVHVTELPCGDNSYIGFRTVEPVAARSAIEAFMETGFFEHIAKTDEFVWRPTSASNDQAAALLAALPFTSQLPIIRRILDVPIPCRRVDGTGHGIPETGYDPAFLTYTLPGAPPLRRMSAEEALDWLRRAHLGFCFANNQALVHAFARVITPYVRGLMGFRARPPLWHYSANRPRAGKDYLAAIPQLIFEGRYTEESPIGKNPEETDKRITSALRAGRRSMHFANCQRRLDDAVFIGMITKHEHGTRNLGSNTAKDALQLPNETEFSLSANTGLAFLPDVEPRTRRIALKFGVDDANSRRFPNPCLHAWVLEHRADLLSAVASLTARWLEAESPPGPLFSSFPEWSYVVGGICNFNGIGDPCQPHEALDSDTPADVEDAGMRALYGAMYIAHPGKWVEKKAIYDVILENKDDDAFAYFGNLDPDKSNDKRKSSETRTGCALRKYMGRELDGIVLKSSGAARTTRATYMFSKESDPERDVLGEFAEKLGLSGTVAARAGGDLPVTFGHLGHLFTPPTRREDTSLSEEGLISAHVPGLTEKVPKVPEVAKACPTIITRADALTAIAEAVRAAGCVCLDIETYGDRRGDALDPWAGDIRLLTLTVPGLNPWILDLRAIGYELGELKPAIEGATVIAHNAKFDLLWLRGKCGLQVLKVFCTLAAARSLTNGTRPKNDLDTCLERYLGVEPGADYSKSDWGGMLLTNEQIDYARRDVAHLHELADTLTAELATAGLERVAQLEANLLPVVVDIEAAGLAVDKDALKRIETSARQAANEKAVQARTLLKRPKLNLASVPELLGALKAAGIKVESTGADVLQEANDGKIIPVILAYRAAEKAAQGAKSLIKEVRNDGRIHGRFEPMGTETGRFSSKTPNLQNIGRGEIRSAFIAPQDHRLIVADYSQIELRVAAVIAPEPKMLEAFRDGVDLHRQTASIVLGKPPSKLTKGDRQMAKAVNFGLLYGQNAGGLVDYAANSYGVTLVVREAEAIRGRFFTAYPGLRAWHSDAWRLAGEGVSEVRTVIGRRRLIPPNADEWQRFTAVVNTPVQGGSADGLKLALIALAAKLPAGSRIVSTVHDEIIVETPEAEADAVCALVRFTMIEAMSSLFPHVRIEAEAAVCMNWGEKQ